MKRKILLLALSIVSLCSWTQLNANDALFESFQSPPAEAKPFVRWWWNGNNVVAEELHRQLDLLDKAGFGGYEINPIAMPSYSKVKPTTPALRWNSTEWNKIVTDLIDDTHKRGMVADLLIGSGWPFGGPSITPENSVQGMMLTTIDCTSGDMISETKESLFKRYLGDTVLRGGDMKMADNYKIRYVRLVPTSLSSLSEVIDLTQMLEKDGKIEYRVPKGEYILSFAIQQEAMRSVAMGVIGSSGLSMDHFRSELVFDYLEQIKKLSTDSGIELSKLIRAIFCDSIELRGSNWTPELESIFAKTYGYSLDPYLPYILYDSHKGYTDSESLPKGLEDQITRARYDYNQLVVDLFNENFTKSLSSFASENGIKARYQAYGGPFLLGIIDGYMLTDIPESNNWLNNSFAPKGYADEFSWGQGHGCMVWNVCAATAARLKGRSIVSSEAMTNTSFCYQGSLADVKLHDDFNFITGINHSVLHGFNYSPKYAGFPGWVRYGEYFSEQNTWWEYIDRWTTYNARLSALFQEAQNIKRIAVFSPEGDHWSEFGLLRNAMHLKPLYNANLWQTLSQCGTGCDYITENIIKGGKVGNGVLSYGEMEYEAIILSDVVSMSSDVATKLEAYVKRGGKVVILDRAPHRTLTMAERENDNITKGCFERMITNYPKQVFSFSSPRQKSQYTEWTKQIVDQAGLYTSVQIERPSKNIHQVHYRSGDTNIYFFTNSHQYDTHSVDVTFPDKERTAWVWNPIDGSRKPYSQQGQKMTIELKPVESLLLVFEREQGEASPAAPKYNTRTPLRLTQPWSVEFQHLNGEVINKEFEELVQINTISELEDFSGTIIYSSCFTSTSEEKLLILPTTNRGTSELYINDRLVGVNWYGEPSFEIGDYLVKGENRIKIRHKTLVTNYCYAINAKHTPKGVIPQGIEGVVMVAK